MNDFASEIRHVTSSLIPPRAFLRRDRGDALFITNARRIDPDRDYEACFVEKGFVIREENDLIRIWPGAEWMSRLEARYPVPPDHLSASLARFSGMQPDPDNIVLFAHGIRILDGDPIRDYEIRLRQRAAVCLRQHTFGGLYACGIVNYLINKECIE